MSNIKSLHRSLCGEELNCDNHQLFEDYLCATGLEIDKICKNHGIVNKIKHVIRKIFNKKRSKEYKILLTKLQEYYSSIDLNDDYPFIPYGDNDPRWIYAAITAIQTFFDSRSKYYIAPKLGNNYHYPLQGTKIAIVGDFGSCDKYQIMTLKAIADLKPDLVIHLGDIYVAGTPDECDLFYKTYSDNINVPLWCLIGNHEYICHGKGFFKNLIKPGLLGNGLQKTSYFSLESEEHKLQILALDTSYKSSNFSLPLSGEVMDYSTCLDDAEARWVASRLQFAKDNDYKTIIMSHHQYFSAFWQDQQFNTELGNQLFSVRQPIALWCAGHDHRLMVYNDEYGLVKRKVILGNGSMPTTIGCYDNPSANFKIDESFIPDTVDQFNTKVYNNGFAILDVPSLSMDFYQVDRNIGTSVKYNTLQINKK